MSKKGMNRIAMLRSARAKNPDAGFAELVPECDPESHASLVELACIDLIDRLRSGNNVRVEEYVSSVPDLQDDDDLLDLIDAEVCVRQELGQPANRDELTKRFPSLSSAIDRMFFLDELEERIQADSQPVRPQLPTVEGYRLLKQLSTTENCATYGAVASGGSRCLLRLFGTGSRDDGSLMSALREVASFRESHPSLLPIQHIGAMGNQVFYTTRFVDGSVMRSLIAKPVEPKKAAEWLRGLAIAFAFADGHEVSLGGVSADQVLIDHRNIPRVIGYCQMPANPQDVLSSFGDLGLEMLNGASNKPADSDVLVPQTEPMQQICRQCLSTGDQSGYRDVSAIIDPLTEYLSGRPIAPQSETGFLGKLFRRK
jgi:hypothetical protein